LFRPRNASIRSWANLEFDPLDRTGGWRGIAAIGVFADAAECGTVAMPAMAASASAEPVANRATATLTARGIAICIASAIARS
jgi:hypothetical protein